MARPQDTRLNVTNSLKAQFLERCLTVNYTNVPQFTNHAPLSDSSGVCVLETMWGQASPCPGLDLSFQIFSQGLGPRRDLLSSA